MAFLGCFELRSFESAKDREEPTAQSVAPEGDGHAPADRVGETLVRCADESRVERHDQMRIEVHDLSERRGAEGFFATRVVLPVLAPIAPERLQEALLLADVRSPRCTKHQMRLLRVDEPGKRSENGVPAAFAHRGIADRLHEGGIQRGFVVPGGQFPFALPAVLPRAAVQRTRILASGIDAKGVLTPTPTARRTCCALHMGATASAEIVVFPQECPAPGRGLGSLAAGSMPVGPWSCSSMLRGRDDADVASGEVELCRID